MDISVDCYKERLDESTDLSNFSCGLEDDKGIVDLNDFFHNDSKKYSKELLGVTYLFRLKETKEIIGFYTISNASLNLKHLRRPVKRKVDKSIPHLKRRRSYPSVLLGRLGVSHELRGKGIGEQILNFLKIDFRFENKTGCRFIIADAYNTEKVKNFYKKNDFSYLQPEDDEMSQLQEERGPEAELSTRHMVFDLAKIEDF